MSKEKEVAVNEKSTVGVSVDNEVSDKSMFEETVSWYDLTLARGDAVGAVLQNQKLVVDLATMKSDEINNNKEVYELVNGLVNTYKELAEDIREISLEHSSVTTTVKNGDTEVEIPKSFKTGEITDNEEELEYISIATNYVSIVEKVGHITGTTFPDILLKLGMENKSVKDAYVEGVKLAEGVKDGE